MDADYKVSQAQETTFNIRHTPWSPSKQCSNELADRARQWHTSKVRTVLHGVAEVDEDHRPSLLHYSDVGLVRPHL